MTNFLYGIAVLPLLLWLSTFNEVTGSSSSPSLRDAILPRGQISPSCKVLPGDDGWPSVADWNSLDSALDGALLKPVPFSAVCHESWPQYDADKCHDRYNTYNNDDQVRTDDPTETIFTYFTNFSCLPSLDPSTPCTTGGIPAYVVNVSSSAHISTAIRFAKKHNVRLVVKNTGHDFNGKSTGEGALSIWTHNLKTIDFIEEWQDEDDHYTGPAFRVGAGVQLSDIYEAAYKQGVTVVGGECSTVGFAGGYIAGGGHSPIGGYFGMAADQVIALTAVLPSGEEVNITRTTEPELFWAFRGGGGSTFGVVTSVVVKAFPKIHVTVSSFVFHTNVGDNETFWSAVREYTDFGHEIADRGWQGWVFLGPPAAGAGYSFTMNSLFMPNTTPAEYSAISSTFYSRLHDLGIDVVQNVTFHDTYYDAWSLAFPVHHYGAFRTTSVATTSRLIPRANFDAVHNPQLRERTFAAFRAVLDSGHNLAMYTQNNDVKPANAVAENAINPAYRSSLLFVFTNEPFSDFAPAAEIDAVHNHVTNVVGQILRDVTPGGGAYLNEADSREPDFQHSFWGSNYERLLKLKQKLDPEGVLYAPTAVGSEFWYVDNGGVLPDVQTGRLCRRET